MSDTVPENPPLFDGALSAEGFPILASYTTSITLRDLFAAAALSGLTANPENRDRMGSDFLSGWAYDIANHMLHARGAK